MAIKKTITIKRVNGTYFKPTGITFDRQGMVSIYGDLWQDAADREANPAEPLLQHVIFLSADAEVKKAALSIIYDAANLFPELAGGTPVYDTESVTLDKENTNIKVGETLTLLTTVLPDNAEIKTVTWESSDETIAKVIDGNVTAISVGQADITVKTLDRNKTAVCKITIIA